MTITIPIVVIIAMLIAVIGGLSLVALFVREVYVACRSCVDENASPERDGLDEIA